MRRTAASILWFLLVLVAGPFLLIEATDARIRGTTSNLWSSFILAWMALARALLLPKRGECYAGVADVFESLHMADNDIYRQFAIGTASADNFLKFSESRPWDLYTLFGYRAASFGARKVLAPGSLLLYPALTNAAHGFSEKHGHIEIVVSGLLGLAASDHVRRQLKFERLQSLERKGECALFVSHSLGIGSFSVASLLRVFDFRNGSFLRKRRAKARADEIERRYRALQQDASQHLVVSPLSSEERSGYLRRQRYTSTPDAVIFVARDSWKAHEPSRPPEILAGVSRIVVHHTSRPLLETTNAALEIRRIQERHLAAGMSDIAYNFLIGPDGILYEGRQGGKGARGEHATRFNDDSIGICLLGNFDTSPDKASNRIGVDSPAFVALKNVVAWLLGEANLHLHEHRKVDSNTRNLRAGVAAIPLPVVVGHCELDSLLDLQGPSTTCPGTTLLELVKQRREIR